MIRKPHVDFTAGVLALAGALEAAVDVTAGTDLTWNVAAIGVAIALQTFVRLYDADRE